MLKNKQKRPQTTLNKTLLFLYELLPKVYQLT